MGYTWSVDGGGGRGRRQSSGVGSLAVVETNTTNLSLFNYSLNGGAHGRDSQSCESQTFMVDFFTLVWWGVWLCGLLGNVVVVQFLGFHMKKSPFTVYILNLAIADFSLILFFVYHLHYMVSTYLLTAISEERCLSVLFPTWYRCHHHNHLSGIVCGVLWALPGIFICLTSICCNFYLMSVWGNICSGADLQSSLIFSTLPLPSDSILFIKLWCCLLRHPPGRLPIMLLTSLFIC
ncbi:PREDICTED: mas-related G-protein coupled receptor member D-like [Haliaeetus leucocephalus]|uniref:mas-related G-protein coupled receptor member D-like n=1 Tax=Haliaeetus leucocephalus TaxID=52644 RepID=UPI00053CD57F|nr:PREDICTED: mas-related G-protein coupled receptor member D-like [Haliaeetus leucocephalus]